MASIKSKSHQPQPGAIKARRQPYREQKRHKVQTHSHEENQHNVQLETIRAKMLDVVQPQEVERWLTTPKKFLNGRTPLQAIEDGEGERILSLWIGLEEGLPL